MQTIKIRLFLGVTLDHEEVTLHMAGEDWWKEKSRQETTQ